MSAMIRASRAAPVRLMNLQRRCMWGVSPADDREALIVPMPDIPTPEPLFDGPTPTQVRERAVPARHPLLAPPPASCAVPPYLPGRPHPRTARCAGRALAWGL